MNLRYQLERFVFWLARVIARFIPRSMFLRLAKKVGRIAYRFDERHRIVALENFRTAFPVATETEAQETIRRCYEWFAAYLFDMLTCFPTIPASRLQSFEVEGAEHLEAAYRRGKGVILYGA